MLGRGSGVRALRRGTAARRRGVRVLRRALRGGRHFPPPARSRRGFGARRDRAPCARRRVRWTRWCSAPGRSPMPGARTLFQTAAREGWQSGGSLYSLGKEAMRRTMLPRMLLLAFGLSALAALLRRMNGWASRGAAAFPRGDAGILFSAHAAAAAGTDRDVRARLRNAAGAPVRAAGAFGAAAVRIYRVGAGGTSRRGRRSATCSGT